MKGAFILVLLLLSGCIGGKPPPKDSGIERLVERNLSKIVLSTEDLGAGWVLATENVTADVYERRFIRVEYSFGAASKLTNRIHLYPSRETAMSDFLLAARQLRETPSTISPQVGDDSVLWTRDSQGYLLFIRGEILVELEHTSSGLAEPDFLIGLAQKTDSRITG